MTIPAALIHTFFSAKYDDAAEPLVFVAAATILLIIAYAISLALLARGRPGLPAVVLTVAIGIHLVAAAVLVPALNGVGAALALGIATGTTVLLLGGSVALSYRLFPGWRSTLRYVLALACLTATLTLVPHNDRIQTVLTLALAAAVYGSALVLTGLITSGDITTAGGALGVRGQQMMARFAGLIDPNRS
jgi:O-antigen/teichoic acid export membrane protein